MSTYLKPTKKGRRFTIKLRGTGIFDPKDPSDPNAVTFQDAVTKFFTEMTGNNIGNDTTVLQAFHNYLRDKGAMKTNSSFTFDRFELFGHDVDPNESDGVV